MLPARSRGRGAAAMADKKKISTPWTKRSGKGQGRDGQSQIFKVSEWDHLPKKLLKSYPDRETKEQVWRPSGSEAMSLKVTVTQKVVFVVIMHTIGSISSVPTIH